jgi:adenine-specific DNA-methyltransferase
VALAESHTLLERVEFFRVDATRKLEGPQRAKMGQFLTPPPVAKFMASLFDDPVQELRVLDAGAGVGSLTAAFVEEMCGRSTPPAQMTATAYEIEPTLVGYLRSTIAECSQLCQACGVRFRGEVLQVDFIQAGVELLHRTLFPTEKRTFSHAILNPPYNKIRSDSTHRRLLRRVGIETSNLYSAFLAVAALLLETGGELVAITPRSFCNGPYFKPFRKLFLGTMTLRRIHVFETRDKAFSDDDVLQENIIFHAIKAGERGKVTISSSDDPEDENMFVREVDYERVVDPEDPEMFIHIATNGLDQSVVDRMNTFRHTLEDLGIAVSTGRVVDFRAKEYLRADPASDTVPLVYPSHLESGFVRWPIPGSRKPNALVFAPKTRALLLPAGHYVLTRRFSAKEERRRLVAAIYDPARVDASFVAFENHLNVYHRNNGGLLEGIAKGLAVFLNSTLVDMYFRQFSGHTQVNATDLRTLRYPSIEILERLGKAMHDELPAQEEIDELLEKEIQRMEALEIPNPDPVTAKKRIDEAVEILRALGMPRGQLNERSGLTLLALLGLESATPWAAASNPLMGITPIMDFARDHYGREYAPNTRETFRRQSMHQFVDAGLAVPNPDALGRPVNSPKFCYQIEPEALALLRTYGTSEWDSSLAAYLESVPALKERYARRRATKMIPFRLPDGREIGLTPGRHNELVKAFYAHFRSRFAKDAFPVYVGDTGDKWAHVDRELLGDLGVTLDPHGKMPDLVLYSREKDWLILVEAVTSHGPVNPKRRGELERLFEGASPGLIYVTAFLTRSEMAKHLGDISWETEVWVMESPTHLVHFDGERFLGPYDG